MGNLKVGAVKLSTASFEDEKKKEKAPMVAFDPAQIGNILNGSSNGPSTQHTQTSFVG